MTNFLSKLYRNKLGLLTDLYELTMAYAYWENEMYDRQAVFHLFYRSDPFEGNFSIAAGLELVIEYLQNFELDVEDIQYLASLKGSTDEPLFDESFLNYLQRMKLQCDIHAIPEGTVAFANQPLIRVKGPLLQAQILETALLNLVNFSTLIATKAARITQAAQGDTVLEFGLRRAQGIDGGLTAARAAYVGGCQATSNVLAGKLFGIPVKGTHAHSWVMSFDKELDSFAAYARAMPNNCIFLVDTYDSIEGIRNAITIGHRLRKQGHKMVGIRLDSGDLVELSKEARQMLDEAGFENAVITASNELDEHSIKELKSKGATITVWGIGTRLVTAYNDPALGGVYKLAAIQDEKGEWQYRVKRSEEVIKSSNPGIQQVRRFVENGKPVADVIYDERISDKNNFVGDDTDISFDFEKGEDVLQPIFEKGKLVYDPPQLSAIRECTLAQLELFGNIDLKNYPIDLEQKLAQHKQYLYDKKEK